MKAFSITLCAATLLATTSALVEAACSDFKAIDISGIDIASISTIVVDVEDCAGAGENVSFEAPTTVNWHFAAASDNTMAITASYADMVIPFVDNGSPSFAGIRILKRFLMPNLEPALTLFSPQRA